MSGYEPVTIQSVSAVIFSYRRWRETFLRVVLNVTCVVGLVAAVLGSLDVWMHGAVVLAFIYVGAWVFTLVLALMKNWPYKLRTSIFLLILYGLGFSGLLENGMRGDGRMFLFAFVTLTALMINPRAGLIAMLASLLTIGGFAALLLTGQVHLLSKITPVGDIWIWSVGTLTFITVVGAVLIGLTLFLREFDASQTRVLNMLENDRKLTARLQQELAVRQQAQAQILQLNEELEQRVRERTSQLEEANQELESFSYSVSHDLRAPLRAINGFTRIIKEDYSSSLNSEGIRFLDRTIASVEQMNQLIEALLRFSRLSRKELTKKVVRTSDVVRKVVEDLPPETAQREIKWILPELPSVLADPILLEQVYVNLISNAVKYTGRREHPQIEVGCLFQDREKVFFVRDDGAGFDMKFAGNLFGVFQRMHRQEDFEGTGIGLATVKRIIERHGGRIWAESEPGKGATFFFTLGR